MPATGIFKDSGIEESNRRVSPPPGMNGMVGLELDSFTCSGAKVYEGILDRPASGVDSREESCLGTTLYSGYLVYVSAVSNNHWSQLAPHLSIGAIG